MIPIAHLVLYELGITMYSSTDCLDELPDSHHGERPWSNATVAARERKEKPSGQNFSKVQKEVFQANLHLFSDI
jgi:hypothetical protein